MTDSEAELKIKQFAKDFGIEYESYKYNQKALIVTFHCVDASPSEVDRYSWSVPAFIISTYDSLIASHDKTVERAARVDERSRAIYVIEKLIADENMGSIQTVFHNRLAELQTNQPESTVRVCPVFDCPNFCMGEPYLPCSVHGVDMVSLTAWRTEE